MAPSPRTDCCTSDQSHTLTVFYGALFNTICNGGRLLFSETSSFIDDAKNCTILPATPALLSAIADPSTYSNIRTLFIGGESSPPSLIKKWSAPNRQLWNGYGPTETTISLTMGELRPGRPITLGTPVRNSKLVLLNHNLEESDEGEIGVMGSAVLALGYYKDPQKTDEKFIHWHGNRLYLTGDLAKRTEDGLIFLGRKDQMVKNRGFLVNLEAEVVPAICSQPGVESAAAVMHLQRLVAFITPASLDGTRLRQNMRSEFDSFIVPDEVYSLDELPQTTNGKIDHRSLLQELSLKKIRSPPIQSTSTGILLVLEEAVGQCLEIPSTFVDVNRSFTELGGNSLLGIKLLSILRQKGLTASTIALFSLPSLVKVSKVLEVIEDADGVLDLVPNVGVSSLKPSHNESSKASFAMTDVQKGIIRSSLKEPLTGYMLVTISLHASQNDIDGDVLSKAWELVLADYELFRSSFEPANESFTISTTYVHDWKTAFSTKATMPDDIARESELLLQAAKSNNRDGNIFTPVNAFRLILSPEKSSVLLWLIHHSLVDGWSVGEILSQVRRQMDNDRHEPPTKQFSTYSQSLSAFSKIAQGKAEKFWTNRLENVTEGTPLNIWNPLGQASKAGAIADESISTGLSLAQLNVGAQSLEVSSAVVLHTAWAVLLSNYADKDEVVFGSVFSGRSFPRENVAEVVGPIINTCPFPVRVSESGSKYDTLQSVKDVLLGIADHQWSASAMLQQLAPGTMARLFQTALFLEYDLPMNSSVAGKPETKWDINKRDWPEFGLTLQVQQAAGEIILRVVYDPGDYQKDSMSPLLHHFRNICLALLDPNVLQLKTVKDMMLTSFNRLNLTRNSPLLYSPYSGSRSLKEKFEHGVRCWPDAVAIESSDESYTYSELNCIGNYVARVISELAGPKQVVAVLADGSRYWLICALAVIKSGAIYLPLDTKLPSERMKSMIHTAGVVLCVYPNSKCHELRSSLPGAHLLAEKIIHNFNSSENRIEALETTTDIDDYAYVMFTSGSTGTPKGIKVTHRATLSHLSFEPARLHARPGRRHAQMFSPGFDVSIAEIFGTLCYGATLVLKDDADGLAHLSRVNATMATPSLLATLPPDQFRNLDTIYLIGEDVPQVLCDSWAGGRTLYNFYGPCECTIAATWTQIEPGKPVTIGKTVPRVGAYVLDRYKRPVPAGVIGEIYISGVQVMEGYIGTDAEAITKRAFGPDPFDRNHRMYKTGDRGAWTSSMDLKFLGRVDHQVKVRGYRVELDEIEHLIRNADASVSRVTAMVIQDAIYAFAVPETVKDGDLISKLCRQLPTYAVPQRIFALPSLPFTPNQKLDRKALGTMVTTASKIQKNNQTLTPIESLIGQKWAESIGLETPTGLGPEDDFLAIGGNSLRQITVARQVCAHLGQNIPLSLFIHNTKMRALAKAIETHTAGQQRNGGVGFDLFTPTAHDGVSYLEEMRYHKHNSSTTPSALNVAFVVTFSGDVKTNLLMQAIEKVMSASDIFRTCFARQGASLRRKILPKTPEVMHEELHSDRIVSALVDLPFNLETGPLTRIAMMGSGQLVQVVFVQHHIITDQTSVALFFRQVGEIYSGLLSGTDVVMKPPRPYADWAQWKNRRLTEPPTTEDVNFWKSHLRNVSNPVHRCPQPPKTLQDAAHSTVARLKKPASAAALGLFLGVTAVAWSRVFNVDSAVIAIPWIDRAEPGTGDMYGLFLDALPVCIPSARTRNLGTIVTEASAAVKSVLSHALPSPQIRRIVQEESLFGVVLVYNRMQDQVSAGLDLQGVSVTSAAKRAAGAKYPVLIEFTEGEDFISLEIEYFKEALSAKALKQLEEELASLLEEISQ